MSKQVNIYTRFSPRSDAATSTSCEKQEERCRAFCARMGYSVVGCYADKDVSGKLLLRPALQGAIDNLQPGMIMVVDTGDRLARDMLVELTIRHQIESIGATIEYADGGPTSITAEGELFRNILAAFAQYERQRFSKRTKEGLAKLKRNGQHLGRAPIGYRYDKETKSLICCAVERRDIAMIRDFEKSGYSSSQIANKFSYLGKAFRGKPWSARTIRKILSEEKNK